MKLLKSSYLSAWSRSFLTRLTVNRFTILYFSFALASCVVLTVLQAITFMGNNEGASILSTALSETNVTQTRDGLPTMVNGHLALCDGIPGRSTVTCEVLWAWGTHPGMLTNGNFSLDPRHAADIDLSPTSSASSDVAKVSVNLPDNCIYSLRWLLETIQDSKREDVVTLCFQIWLCSLAFVTLLNESIPHLAAGLFGHVLGTGWAAYRVQSTVRLTNLYRQAVVPELCSGQDFLNSWWNDRRSLAIGIIVVNACALAAMVYLSYMLLQIYVRQSFVRVGTCDRIRRIYKIILLFSAGLQLTGFFSLASISIWLDKINQGVVRRFTAHGKLYLAIFIVILVLLIPWLIMGWVCVRRECLRRYAVFCIISLFLITVFTSLFFSQVYRFIFLSWSFFATITVTGYVCVVITAILGVLCRLNFGKGLAHYLHVNNTLAGANFPAGTFYDHKPDPEGVFSLMQKSSNFKTSPTTDHENIFTSTRGSSVYSRSESEPIKLSLTPPDVKCLIADTAYGDTSRQIALVTRDVDTNKDLLPLSTAKPRLSASFTRPLLRLSELPERISSLASLRQAISEFPLPPTGVAPSQAINRYGASPSQVSLPLDGKDSRVHGLQKSSRP